MKVVLLLIATMGVSYSSACSCSLPFVAPVCATNGETYKNRCSLFCEHWLKIGACHRKEVICKKNPEDPICNMHCDYPKFKCHGPCPCVEPDKADDPKFETIIISE